MKCKPCGGPSRIVAASGRERVRECTACRVRWVSTEILLGFSISELPATAESVLKLRSEGKHIRQIAQALHMSTRTVRQHLAAAPSLDKVWR